MQITISLDGKSSVPEATELREWLHSARISQIDKLTQEELPPKPGEQGPELLAIVTVILGSKALVELIHSIHRYIEARTPKTRIEIKNGDKVIIIDSTNPPSVSELVRQAQILSAS